MRDISKVIPVIRVDYSKFVGIDQIVAAVKQEYERIHNVRHITFEANEG